MVKAYEHNAGIIRHLGKHNKKKIDDSKKTSLYCYIVTLKNSTPMIESDQYQMSF